MDRRSNVPVPKISIVNVVATAALDRPVDLESLNLSSGKMISVGTKSQEKAKQELALVASYLKKK